MIDRFLLSRLESLSATPTSLSFLRFRSKSFKSSEGVQGETVSVVSVFFRSSRRPSSALRDLRPRSSSDVRRNSLLKPAPPVTDSPTLASRLVGQCFYSDAGASGGKTLISRLNLYPSATCRALRACPLWDLLSVSASALQTRKPPQTPQVKEDTYARMWVLSSYSITRPEGRIGGINLYVMIEAFRTYGIVFRKPFQGPSELPLCLRLIKYIDTLYLYPFRQGVFP